MVSGARKYAQISQVYSFEIEFCNQSGTYIFLVQILHPTGGAQT